MKNWLNTHKNLFVPNIGTLVLVALLLGAYQVFASSPTGTLPQAGIPGFLFYQGTLTDTSGNPLNGAINMVFRFYAVPTGGTPLWEEVHQGENGVPVTQGLFHINLGSIAPIPAIVWENSQLYLGVQVGNDAELSPRQPVGGVPVALTVPDGAITRAKLGDDVHEYLIQSGIKICDWVSCPEWTLHEGSGNRYAVVNVSFPQPFASPPTVTVNISSFDMEEDVNARFTVYAQNVTTSGFQMVYYTWADSAVFGASATWLAYGNP